MQKAITDAGTRLTGSAGKVITVYFRSFGKQIIEEGELASVAGGSIYMRSGRDGTYRIGMNDTDVVGGQKMSEVWKIKDSSGEFVINPSAKFDDTQKTGSMADQKTRDKV